MHETELLILGLCVRDPGAQRDRASCSTSRTRSCSCSGRYRSAIVPGVPDVELEPDLVLVIFLPPLLYVAAFFADLRALRADARGLSLTSIGLVLLTTCVVAVVGHELIGPALGGRLRARRHRLRPPTRWRRRAIARAARRSAAAGRAHRGGEPGQRLVRADRVPGRRCRGGGRQLLPGRRQRRLRRGGGWAGSPSGCVVGAAIAEVRRRLDDVPVEITISLFTGFAAYLPAEALGVSGVLAAVTAGIYLGWMAPQVLDRADADPGCSGVGADRLPAQRACCSS